MEPVVVTGRREGAAPDPACCERHDVHDPA
jgi:hypothetical protein